jgi:hypothetical protein
MHIVVEIQKRQNLLKKVKYCEIYIDNEPEGIMEQWKEEGVL